MLTAEIYRVCCCLSAYSPYQELYDPGVKAKNTENLNLKPATGPVQDYRSVVISNPSSSSFEPEISENEEVEKEETNLNTDLYNTGNLNKTSMEEAANPADVEPTDNPSRHSPAPSVYTIQSDVSHQLTSWQSASFAMAQASTKHRSKRASKVPEEEEEEGDNTNTPRARSRDRSKKRSRNETVETTETVGDSSLSKLKEKMQKKEGEKKKEEMKEEVAPVTAGSLFNSLMSKDEDGKGKIQTREGRAQVRAEKKEKRAASKEKSKPVVGEEIPPPPHVTAGSLFQSLLSREPLPVQPRVNRQKSADQEHRSIKLESAQEQGRPARVDKETLEQKTKDYVASIPIHQHEELPDTFQEPAEKAPKPTRVKIPSFEPIKRLMDVFSGNVDIEKAPKDSPVSLPTLVTELQSDVIEPSEEELESVLSESVLGNYSDIPTSDISTGRTYCSSVHVTWSL